jgi:DNA-binding NarL/FixJ family response regulator
MVVLLDGDDIEVEVCENLEEWTPRQGGTCIVLGVGGDDDLDLLRAFHDDHSFTPVVAVSDDVSVSTFARLIRSGATTVVGETEPSDVLRGVVLTALGGRASMSADMTRRLAEFVPDEDDWSSWVSGHEADWLRAMASGSTVLDLAEDAGYSERAMFRNLKSVYMRIGVKNRTEALIWASRNGLLDING